MYMRRCRVEGRLWMQCCCWHVSGFCQCRLLQNAATSALGQELISYAKYLGIKTINVVRRREAVNELKLKG